MKCALFVKPIQLLSLCATLVFSNFIGQANIQREGPQQDKVQIEHQLAAQPTLTVGNNTVATPLTNELDQGALNSPISNIMDHVGNSVFSKIASLGASGADVTYLNEALATLGYLPLNFVATPKGSQKPMSPAKSPGQPVSTSSHTPSQSNNSSTTGNTSIMSNNTTTEQNATTENDLDNNSNTSVGNNSTDATNTTDANVTETESNGTDATMMNGSNTNTTSQNLTASDSNLVNTATPLVLVKQRVNAAKSQITSMNSQLLLPATGSFAWLYPSAHQALGSLWNANQYTVITEGAVMRFESASSLAVDGVAGPEVWSALAKALANHTFASTPYVSIIVTTTAPERLEVWSGNKILVSTLANTGISETPTPYGTWPVYLRLPSQTMSGTLPDGETYSDPGVPWINYFNGGDAVHGFVRSSYGFPQSLGCVELPPANAKIVYAEVQLGTLVTVTSHSLPH